MVRGGRLAAAACGHKQQQPWQQEHWLQPGQEQGPQQLSRLACPATRACHTQSLLPCVQHPQQQLQQQQCVQQLLQPLSERQGCACVSLLQAQARLLWLLLPLVQLPLLLLLAPLQLP